MAKKSDSETEVVPLVSVQLKCVYAGFPGDPGPGAIIEVDAAEADRLVEVGAADKVSPEKAEEQK